MQHDSSTTEASVRPEISTTEASVHPDISTTEARAHHKSSTTEASVYPEISTTEARVHHSSNSRDQDVVQLANQRKELERYRGTPVEKLYLAKVQPVQLFSSQSAASSINGSQGAP